MFIRSTRCRSRYVVDALIAFLLVIASHSLIAALQYCADCNTFDQTYKALLPHKKENGQTQKWDTNAITYSFVTAENSKSYPNKHYKGISSVPEETKGYVKEILQQYASVIPVTFKEVKDTNNPKTSANIRVMLIKEKDDEFAAFASMPKDYDDPRDGDIYLNSHGYDWTKGIGSFEYTALIHELGHAMGLKHSGRYSTADTPPFLPLEMDHSLNTVMSYNADEDLAQKSSSQNWWNWSLMAHDIAALQSLYGVNKTFHAGDTVYKFNGDGTSHFSYSGTERQFKATQAIWDAGGNNTIDVSALPAEANGYYYDLRPGGQLTTKAAFNAGSYVLDAPDTQNPKGNANETFKVSKFGTVIGFGVTIKNLQGSSSSDQVIGNSADNRIFGNAGNDRLDGGAGNDWIEGGADGDVLIARAGQNVLLGGAGDDLYQIAEKAAGTRIIDTEGYDEVAFGDRTPSLRLRAGELGMTRQKDDLMIDLNADGVIKPKQDLVIEQFFSGSSIASIGNLKKQAIAAAFDS